MKEKKIVLSVLFVFLFSFLSGAQEPGVQSDIRQAKIDKNKEIVYDKAKKVIAEACPDGFEITRRELYKNSIYKIHFQTNCDQSGEVHYEAVSGDHKETLWY